MELPENTNFYNLEVKDRSSDIKEVEKLRNQEFKHFWFLIFDYKLNLFTILLSPSEISLSFLHIFIYTFY